MGVHCFRKQIHCTCGKHPRLFDAVVSEYSSSVIVIKCPECKKEVVIELGKLVQKRYRNMRQQ